MTYKLYKRPILHFVSGEYKKEKNILMYALPSQTINRFFIFYIVNNR